MIKNIKYDKIGIGYNQTRKADPYLLSRLYELLQANDTGRYLDIGCGTGNYTIPLHQKGIDFTGVDPSAKMLEKAKQRCPSICWIQGSVERSNLPPNSFDSAIASLTLHHWKDLDLGMNNIQHLLKPNARFVIFTSTAEQMEGYWLKEYFPRMLDDSIQQMPSLSTIRNSLVSSGFDIVKEEPYSVKEDLEDLFLYAGKYRPEIYLDENVRKGISSFSDLSRQKEVKKGLALLKADITSGQIQHIISRYENGKGDYMFFLASKRDV
jgi:SAM-dependent methyltransferase